MGHLRPTTEAIAQGGSGPTFLPNVDQSAISIALPDQAFATTLIGDASHVAAVLLGPGYEIFGAAILWGGSSTFDFQYQGDLLLGDIADDTVIDLGSNWGPTIDLTLSTPGAYVIGGVVPGTVPEASTWAMLVLGFAGLGLVGYRQTRAAKPRAA
jgi:hypothetical protein